MGSRNFRFSALVVLAWTCAPFCALAEDPSPVLGRWDLTIRGLDFPAFGWLEVQQSGERTLVGRFVGWWGSARPIERINFQNNALHFSIPPQWEKGNDDLRVDGVLQDGEFSGTMVDPAGTRLTWSGKRAPVLQRAEPPAWHTPIVLFDGRDISQWRTQPNNHWQVVAGVLTNLKAGGNLVTRESFSDFRLHVEFKYPKAGNSGIYLRGRYELQIEDSPPGRVRTEGLGAVYGFLSPNSDAGKGPGQWQTCDLELVGRLVTVRLNAMAIINKQEIPGITGGAMSSDELAPGPIMLQGDHGLIEFRNVVLTPTK